MKQLLKKILLKISYHLGVYPSRLLKPDQLYNLLQNKPDVVKEHELNRMTSFIRIVNNQKYYNDLLQCFVPKWNMTINDSKFIGYGIGGSSFDTFRMVQTD